MTEYICKNSIQDFVLTEISTQVKFCIDKFNLSDDWMPLLKITFTKNRIHSQAGRNAEKKPFMILALAKFLQPVYGFLEYEQYSKNTVIGSFRSNSWRICVSALIAHELAHAVQFTIPVSDSSFSIDYTTTHTLGEYEPGHGAFFQNIYRALRKEFINKQVSNDCMGLDPRVPAIQKHALAGTVFHHTELGKCVITNYHPRTKIHPYEYMDVSGKLFKSSKERMASVALFDYY